MTTTPDVFASTTIPASTLPTTTIPATAGAPASHGAIAAVLDRLARHRHELLDRTRYAADPALPRWHHRFTPGEAGTTDVEVWLLSWLPGQESPLHDHGGAAGAFTVLFGTLDETVVNRRTGTSADQLWTPGRLRSFGGELVHRVGNDGDSPAVSLHVYAPSLDRMTRYRRSDIARADSALVTTSVERAGDDW